MAESTVVFGAVDNVSDVVKNIEGRVQGFESSVNDTAASTALAAVKFAAVATAIAAVAAGAAIAAGVIKSLGIAMDIAERLQDLSQRTGEAAGKLALLERAFENAGAKAGDVGPALSRLQNVIGEAASGSSKAQEKLTALGLTFEQLKGMTPTEQLEAVAQKISKLPTQSERAAAAIDFFGQALGPRLLPLIEQFAQEMAKAEEQLGSFPRIIDTYAPALNRLKDNLDALKGKAGEFATGFAGPIAEILANLAAKFTNFDAAGLGEKIGMEFRNILVNALIFVEDMSNMLKGIWNGMKDSAQPVIDAIGQAFANLRETVRPHIEGISEDFRNLDYSAIGQGIGQQFGFALDVAKGIFADPSAIFGLYGRYLDFTFRLAGDTLISVFVTAVEAIGRAWVSLFNTDLMGSFAKIFANAMILGIVQINLKFLDMFETAMRFFASLWNAVTGEGVSAFALRLYDLIKNFGSDLLMALTNPLGFFTGKLASALIDGSKQGADAYEINFDKATGGILAKTRAGLEGVGEAATQNIKQGFAEAGNSLVTAVSSAVTQTEGFKSNLFGSAEAGERLKAAADVVAEKGREYFQSVDGAAQTLDSANKDLRITADLYTGPGGVAEATKQAAAATTEASRQSSAAFDNVAKSGQAVEQSVQRSGDNFGKQVVDAGTWFKQEVVGALGRMTDFTRGLATESTLQRAANAIERLERKLPQPVLT